MCTRKKQKTEPVNLEQMHKNQPRKIKTAEMNNAECVRTCERAPTREESVTNAL